MSNLPSISEAEYEVMKIIWTETPINTNQVVEKLLKTSSWTEKTIQTMLSRLVKKGALDFQKKGRVYTYTPLISEDDYLDYESSTFLNRFFSGKLSSMIVSFMEKEKLSKSEIANLKQILEERLTDGED